MDAMTPGPKSAAPPNTAATDKHENGSDRRVIVFDTSLRDGEQAPGAAMDLTHKLQVARALQALGVDVLEAGFPAASPGDYEAVGAVARQIEGPIVCALARANREDIDRVTESLRPAGRKRCHVFLATSPIHREFKLGFGTAEVVRRAVEAIRYARESFDDVEYSAEDAARTEPDFLCEVVEKVIEAGATTINIPDTVGYAIPSQFAGLILHLRRRVRGIERVVLSVHCHDDLGLAVANTLAALEAGARQVECTVNGIGERAGNCSLEEVVMALRTRADHFRLRTGIRTQELCAASRAVAKASGFSVAPNKAVVGQNAFAHEAGIHQHGVLANALTYEIMRPDDVGFESSRLVLGKHSGRHLLRHRLEQLGYRLDDSQFERAFVEVKKLADHKKELHDGDLEAVIAGVLHGVAAGQWELLGVSTASGAGLATAAVTLRARDGKEVQDAACGQSPLEAVFRSIERITGTAARVRNYQVGGSGGDAEVRIEVQHRDRTYSGTAHAADVLAGSARAFIEVVNRIAASLRTRRESVGSEART